VEQVEGVVEQIRVDSVVERLFERLEIGQAAGRQGHELAVDDRVLRRDGREFPDERRQGVGPIGAVGSPQSGTGRPDRCDDAAAVELDFVDPLVACRGSGDGRRELEGDGRLRQAVLGPRREGLLPVARATLCLRSVIMSVTLPRSAGSRGSGVGRAPPDSAFRLIAPSSSSR